MKNVQAELGSSLSLPLAGAPVQTRAADFLALTKPRLNLLVVATTAVAHYLGAGDRLSLPLLLHAVAGTALVAAGAASLNQAAEWRTDALMARTRHRPVPDGRVQPRDAHLFGLALSAAGLIELAVGANPLAAALAFVTLLSYTAVYTPLKRRTRHSTLVGAVPGALPPLIGWAAARGSLSIEAWTLFAIVFCWQMPHFLAIAWLYRDDYERAGFPLIAVIEPDGRTSGRQAILYASALLLISVIPFAIDLAGRWYLAGAVALGAGLLGLAAQFAARRNTARARALFLATIVYLPALWVLLIADRVGP